MESPRRDNQDEDRKETKVDKKAPRKNLDKTARHVSKPTLSEKALYGGRGAPPLHWGAMLVLRGPIGGPCFTMGS